MRKDRPAIETSPQSEKPFRPYMTVYFSDYGRLTKPVSRDELAGAFDAIAANREMKIDINYGERRESHDYRRDPIRERPFTEPSLSADFRDHGRIFVIKGIPSDSTTRQEFYVGARFYRQPLRRMDRNYGKDSVVFAEAAIEILKRELTPKSKSSA